MMGDELGLSPSLELGDRRTDGGLDSGLDDAAGGDCSGGASIQTFLKKRYRFNVMTEELDVVVDAKWWVEYWRS